MSSQTDYQFSHRHLRMAALALLASAAFAFPAAAQSTSRSTTSQEQDSFSRDRNAFLRGTTTNGTGLSDSAETANLPYPRSRPAMADDGGSPDPFVPSYAQSVAPEEDADPSATGLADTESDFSTGRVSTLDGALAEDNQYGRINTPQSSVDGLQTGSTPDDGAPPGIRLGTMILRPTLIQKITHEQSKFGSSSDKRTFSETTLEATLESDWSRHRLTLDGAATLQKNLSGTSQEEPEAEINATFDIDLSEGTSAQLRAGYDYSREDRTDPNAVANATAQAAVHNFSSSASLTKSLGQLRGTATAELGRTIYGDATLSGGSVISGRDRDNTNYGLRARIGYEVSPALIPFVEASVNRANYDIKTDSSGFKRSSTTYGLKVGAELPLGDKISGELSAGYLRRLIDDPALDGIGAFSVDGSLNWSPMRGTTLNATLSTALESSTTAGQSGSVVHQLSLGLEHQLRSSVVARLTGTALRRNYQGAAAPADQTTLGLSGELDWAVNRYLSVVTEAGYERTTQQGSSDSSTATIGLGLRLRR